MANFNVQQIKNAVNNLTYKVFETDSRPFNLNIVGIRNDNVIVDKFNDWIAVFYKFKGAWHYFEYPVTTVPGSFYLKAPENQNGTAILKEGQYRSAFTFGLHKGQYPCLVQCVPLVVLRDNHRDGHLHFDGQEYPEPATIEIHRASAWHESQVVFNWSAGCQVFQDPKDFAEFMSLCHSAQPVWGDKFTYTLINKGHL